MTKLQMNGPYQITICAIGFKTPTHAEEFMKEFDGFDIVVVNSFSITSSFCQLLFFFFPHDDSNGNCA